LFLTYWTAGERAEAPSYIKLGLPPVQSRLMEQVNLGPGMFSARAFALDDDTVVLHVRGPVIDSSGIERLEQWYV
jgi:hypothetical protein